MDLQGLGKLTARILDFIDRVLLIQQLAGSFKAVAMALAAGFIEWLRNSGPLGTGLVVVVVYLLITLIERLPRLLSIRFRSPPNEQQPDGLEEWVRHFDRLFVIEINRMSFRHLWNDTGDQPNAEPYLEFEIVTWNNTPFAIEITGNQGQAAIDGDDCHFSVLLPTGTPMPVGAWGYRTPIIKQPLLTEKGRELLSKIENGTPIRFSLSSIRLLVEDTSGKMPNRPMQVNVGFDVYPTGITRDRHEVTRHAQILKNS